MGFAQFELQSQLEIEAIPGYPRAWLWTFFLGLQVNMSGSFCEIRVVQLLLSFWSYGNLCVSHFKVVTLCIHQTWKSLEILVVEIVRHHIYPCKEGSRWRRPSIIHDDVVLYIRREPLISQEGFSDYAQSCAILKLLLLIHCLSKSKI